MGPVLSVICFMRPNWRFTVLVAFVGLALVLWLVSAFIAQRGYREIVAAETIRLCGIAGCRYWAELGSFPDSVQGLEYAGIIDRDQFKENFALVDEGGTTQAVFLDSVRFQLPEARTAWRLADDFVRAADGTEVAPLVTIAHGPRGPAVRQAERYVVRLFCSLERGCGWEDSAIERWIRSAGKRRTSSSGPARPAPGSTCPASP
jgi:hypothetical protein